MRGRKVKCMIVTQDRRDPSSTYTFIFQNLYVYNNTSNNNTFEVASKIQTNSILKYIICLEAKFSRMGFCKLQFNLLSSLLELLSNTKPLVFGTE